MKRDRILLTAGALGFAAMPFLLNTYWVDVLNSVGIYAILALSLNLIVGHSGLFNLGHAAFYAIGAYGVFVLRRRMTDAPRPYIVPGYPLVPLVFVLFATLYLLFTVYNDIIGYQAAVAAGRPAMINSAFGTMLTLIGAPIYFFYRRRQSDIVRRLR